jgi:hypothetical protein
MNIDRAKLASETLEDVFTPDGDAGVIAELDRLEDEADDGTVIARLSGRLVEGKWYDILDLKTVEDLRAERVAEAARA